MGASKFTAALALAVLLAAQASAATYNATGWLPRFQSSGDEPIGITQAYLLQAGIPAIVWIVIGVIAFFTYVWWDCCGCGCCPCCPKDGDVNCFCCSETVAKWIYVFLGVGLVGAAAGMAIYGLDVNTAQAEAIASLPNVTAGFDSWLSQALTIIAQVQSNVAATEALLSAPPYAGRPQADAMVTTLQAIQAAVNSTTETISGFDVGKITSEFTPFLEDIEQYRSPVFIGTLAGLLAVSVLQIVFAMSNLFCVNWLKPNECCLGTILQGTMSAIFLLVLLVVFVAGGVLMCVTTITADVCEKPGQALVDLAGIGSDFSYYFTCDSLTPAEQADQNPFKDQIVTLNNAINAINQAFADITAACPPACDQDDIDNLTAAVQGLTQAVSSLTSLIGCTAVSAIWQSVAVVLCGNFGGSLAQTTVLIAAIGALMLFVAPVKHKLNDIYKDEKTNKAV